MAVSPFGGKVLTRAHYMASRGFVEGDAAQNANPRPTKGCDRWALLRALTETREHFGLSDRTIIVLEALTSFHPGRYLPTGAPLVVFPSNAELSTRARGMSPATLRRHLSALVECGFIVRRDSANGKRYADRDPNGQLLQAYGFDLSPFIGRASLVFAAAERHRKCLSEIRRLRAEVTIRQRDVAKTLAMLRAEGRGEQLIDLDARFCELQGRLARNATLEQLNARAAAFHGLQRDIENGFLIPSDCNNLDDKKHVETSGNADQNERHIETKNTESTLIENGLKIDCATARLQIPLSLSSSNKAIPAPEQLKRTAPTIPSLPSVAEIGRLCPQIASYARCGLHGWPDLLQAAETVQAMLGISSDAWREARFGFGPAGAAIVVAAMLENVEAIRSPGGYLRHLTDEAKKGAFSLELQLERLRERYLKSRIIAG
nr:plasmid replication protein RepC [Aliihoeflea sp. 40Bstr573]